jgi:hypothetical protein
MRRNITEDGIPYRLFDSLPRIVPRLYARLLTNHSRSFGMKGVSVCGALAREPVPEQIDMEMKAASASASRTFFWSN